MEADLVMVSGVAALLHLVTQSQFQEFRAEDVVLLQRRCRLAQAMALARPRHPDVDLAQEQDVGSGSADQGAGSIEMREALGIPVGDPQRPSSLGRPCGTSLDQS